MRKHQIALQSKPEEKTKIFITLKYIQRFGVPDKREKEKEKR
jgi:hypothetical protein